MNIGTDYIIQTNSLSYNYNDYQALKQINLSIPRGSIYGFLGPNGAGKTTTIKTLLGLLHTAPGMIYLFGKELNNNKISILSRIGAMVESPSLIDHLNAYQNLEYTARLRNMPLNGISSLIEMVSLSKDANRKVKQYSTGMKQRLSLAIALLPSPDLLILDEPTNGLDPNGIIEMRMLLQQINAEQKCTILLSSHILSEIEKLCSDVAIINQGSIIYEGNMHELLGMKTGKGTVALYCNDLIKASEVLKNTYDFKIKNDCLIASINSKTDTASIIRLLVENEISIFSVENEGSGLEASFLKLLNKKN